MNFLGMLSRISDGWGALRVVGLRSAGWLMVYRAGLGSGWYRLRTPLRPWKSVAQECKARLPGRRDAPGPAFFFSAARDLAKPLAGLRPGAETAARAELEEILAGRFAFWSETISAGFPPDWNRNPLTGRALPADRHWSRVEESASGDIKGIWELSRFAVAFRLARIYTITGDERAPAAFGRLVDSWLDANPPNSGPQWTSAQEVALRALAWEFAAQAFSSSGVPMPSRLEAALCEHARRIEATPAYARAQRNNHLMSEAAGLYTIGLLHPRLPGAGRWKRRGRRLLLESAGQFFPDGGYIQHSMVYHRLALQLMMWAMRLAELHAEPFPDWMYRRLEASLAFLTGLVDTGTGRLPNFGHNDGTLFLPFHPGNFNDYRPLLQSLSIWLRKQRAVASAEGDEDAIWLLGASAVEQAASAKMEASAEKQDAVSAPEAGLFSLRNGESRAVIRCARFRSRPAHSDQLHVDVWWRGENLACDAGSYRYTAASPWDNALATAVIHNGVVVDGLDPMRRTGRFLWTRLAQAHAEDSPPRGWAGMHDGYRSLGIVCSRAVQPLPADGWLVRDVLVGPGRHTASLHWLMPDVPWTWMDAHEAEAAGMSLADGFPIHRRLLRLAARRGVVVLAVGCSAAPVWKICRAGKCIDGLADDGLDEIRGWRSPHYNTKEPALSFVIGACGDLPVRFFSQWIFLTP